MRGHLAAKRMPDLVGWHVQFDLSVVHGTGDDRRM
jgi:hypothetical protein